MGLGGERQTAARPRQDQNIGLEQATRNMRGETNRVSSEGVRLGDWIYKLAVWWLEQCWRTGQLCARWMGKLYTLIWPLRGEGERHGRRL